MKKPFKIILITFIVIAVLCTAGIIFYKPVYDVVAPVIFDKFVAENLDKFIGEDNKNEASEKEEKEEAQNEENKKDDGLNDENKEEKEGEKKSDDKNNSPSSKNDINGSYSTKTTNGVYTDKDLQYLIKVISPQDKSRIISILQSCVAAADYPDMARRASDGLDSADMAYIESYLRARMTIPQKQAILDIVAKYI